MHDRLRSLQSATRGHPGPVSEATLASTNLSGIAGKIETILRCVERARGEHARAGESFRLDFTHQDAAILNVLRACEAATDLANMLIRQRRLGLPAQMRESFQILERSGLIPASLSERLQKMIGFRNIAIHQYQKIDLDIVVEVIRNGLDDLLDFAETIRPHLAADG